MKRYIITLAIIFAGLTLWGIRALASSSAGPNDCGTASDDSSVGTASWTSPTNACGDDGLYATAVIPASGGTTHHLDATHFGFSIPTGATINGIQVDVKSSTDSGVLNWNRDYIIKGGTVGSTNVQTSGYPISTTMNYDTIPTSGASTELWGETWTPADINNSNFGVAIGIVNGFSTPANITVSVDNIRITVYYTTASGAHASVTHTSGTWVITGGKTIIQ
jgi:hypothetical protein